MHIHHIPRQAQRKENLPTLATLHPSTPTLGSSNPRTTVHVAAPGRNITYRPDLSHSVQCNENPFIKDFSSEAEISMI